MKINETLFIDEGELREQFVRSSGPGGQNVNKVSTAVQLRFDVAGSPSLPVEVKERLLRLGGRKITEEGVLIIDARRFRTQDQNRKDARERLAALVRQACQRPRPRRRTRPTVGSIHRRLESKRHRALLKQARQGPGANGE